MTRLYRRWPSHVMVGSLLVSPVTQVQASGYHFGSQSVAAQGSAHANGAEAADPSERRARLRTEVAPYARARDPGGT